MPVTDLSTGDDWANWLRAFGGGGQQLGGLEGQTMYGAPATRPGPSGALEPPTLDLSANQMVPRGYQPPGGGADPRLGFQLSAEPQPQTITPQSWQDVINGRSAISGAPGGGLPPAVAALLGGMNPLARAAIAAASVMAPTPTAANDQFFRQQPGRPVTPTPQPYGGPMAAADAARAPRGPLAAPIDPYGATRGAPVMSASAPLPPPRARPSASPAAPATAPPQSRFVQIDRPNAPANRGPYGAGGPPQMSALDLSQLFRRRG
jgi:hypothetical protein